MDEISLPVDRLRETGEHILSETDALTSETSFRWQQIHNTSFGLPVQMQETLDHVFGPLRQDMQAGLAQRENIGTLLLHTATLAETVEQFIKDFF